MCFGLVMALLYLSTRSLLVSMVAHSVSNGIAILVEFVTLQTSTSLPADILTEFRASWWLGTLCLVVSTPPGSGAFLAQQWPNSQTQLPYFANQGNPEELPQPLVTGEEP